MPLTSKFGGMSTGAIAGKTTVLSRYDSLGNPIAENNYTGVTGGGSVGNDYQTQLAQAAQIQAQADQQAAMQSRAWLQQRWSDFENFLNADTAEAQQLYAAQSQAAQTRERQEQAWAEQRATARQLELANDPRYQMAQAYLTESFAAGVPEFMAREYENRLRAAQAARGLERGGAPTQQEAALLTSMAAQNRQAILPQLMESYETDASRKSQYQQEELAIAAAAQQMGQSQLSTNTQAYATQLQAQLSRSAQLASLFGGTMGLANFSNAAVGAYSPFANAAGSWQTTTDYSGFTPYASQWVSW